jgi:hypothetical protein
MSAVDMATAKPLVIGMSAIGLGGAAVPASFVPVGSMTYLAYSTATNPLATFRAARSVVRDAAARIRLHKSQSMDLVWGLADRLEAGGDQYLACVLAGLDVCGDLRLAMRAADDAVASQDSALKGYFVSADAEKQFEARQPKAAPVIDPRTVQSDLRPDAVLIHGIPVVLEEFAGQRIQTSARDEARLPIAVNSYGYIPNTLGGDGDCIDVFLGRELTATTVYVVDQERPDGTFDEHKVMICFSSSDEARAGYLANYIPEWNGFAGIRAMSPEEFDAWLDSYNPNLPATAWTATKAVEELMAKGSALQDCVGRKIPILKEEHPEWAHDQVIAVAYSYCRRKRKKTALAESSGATGGYLTVPGGSRVVQTCPKCGEFLADGKCPECTETKKLESDESDRVELMADILCGLLGDDADAVLAAWGQADKSFCPTGVGGGVDPSCSPGGHAQSPPAAGGADHSARNLADDLRSQGRPPTLDETNTMAGHLMGMSVAELRKFRQDYGLRGSGPTREAFVNVLTEKIRRGDLGSPTATPSPAPTPPPPKPGPKPAPKPAKPGKLPKFPPSKADVTVKPELMSREQSERFVKQYAEKIWGKGAGPEKFAALVGAPDDAKVTLRPLAMGKMRINVESKDVSAERVVHDEGHGIRWIYNDSFYVLGGTGRGVGAEMFSKQASFAQESGFSYIQTYAAGAAGSTEYNGYYTWPRFGYDQSLATLSDDVNREAKKVFPKAKSVLDVMSTAQGREWWKNNGERLTQARFDLTEGSRSTQVLAAYLEERKNRPAGKVLVLKKKSEDAEEIELSDEDEAALDRAWARLEKEWQEKGFDPNQSRVPAGQPGGGRWAGGATPAASQAEPAGVSAQSPVQASASTADRGARDLADRLRGQGPPSAADLDTMAGHLSNMSVGELRKFRQDYGLKGSGATKEQFVAVLKEKIRRGDLKIGDIKPPPPPVPPPNPPPPVPPPNPPPPPEPNPPPKRDKPAPKVSLLRKYGNIRDALDNYTEGDEIMYKVLDAGGDIYADESERIKSRLEALRDEWSKVPYTRRGRELLREMSRLTEQNIRNTRATIKAQEENIVQRRYDNRRLVLSISRKVERGDQSVGRPDREAREGLRARWARKGCGPIGRRRQGDRRG